MTENFFNISKTKNYKLYVSDIVFDEVRRTPDSDKRELLLGVMRNYGCIEVRRTDECERLANKYIAGKVIPQTYRPDALHISIATVYKIPVLVSWNFKHIVRHKTRMGVNSINKTCGYNGIDTCSPEEVD